MDRFRALAEAAIAFRVPRAGKGADGIGGTVDVGEKIQTRGSAPRVARQNLSRVKFQPIVDRDANLASNFVEHPPHREYGRAGVYPRAANDGFAHFAARRPGRLDDGDGHAMRRQSKRGDKTADARSNDHDSAHPHSGRPQTTK
jgi:hypothetical protein